MSTTQCNTLRAAYAGALERPTRVLVLMGGPDYWSNGIRLGLIEAAESPAASGQLPMYVGSTRATAGLYDIPRWTNIDSQLDVALTDLPRSDRAALGAQ